MIGLLFAIVVVVGFTSLLWFLNKDFTPASMTPPPQNEDWICHYCKSKNDFELENCGKCGAPESH